MNRYVYLGTWAHKANTYRSGPWVTMGVTRRKVINVSELYPSCKTLFHGLLGMDGGQVEVLTKTAATISDAWSLAEICDVLVKISAGLAHTTPSRCRTLTRPLRKSRIFPIRTRQDQDSYDTPVSLDNDNDDNDDCTWFIADKPRLDVSFRGIVPLLAFSTAQIGKMSALLQSLGLDSRRLSLMTRQAVFPSGRTNYSSRDTKFFQSRSSYIKL